MKHVIGHASIIPQSWTDTDTFVKIKNIISFLGIQKVVMYPSNIVECIHEPLLQDKLLDNIEHIAPLLTIHTDCCPSHGMPERVFLFENNEKALVKQRLFEPSQCPDALQKASRQEAMGFTMDEMLLLMMLFGQKFDRQHDHTTSGYQQGASHKKPFGHF